VMNNSLGGDDDEATAGCELFVYGISDKVTRIELVNVFGQHGNIADAVNPGNGFAFITFSRYSP